MENILIKTEYITLAQFLKYIGIVDSGSEAKILINEGKVLVNGQIETRRGKKLYSNDKVSFKNKEYVITR